MTGIEFTADSLSLTEHLWILPQKDLKGICGDQRLSNHIIAATTEALATSYHRLLKEADELYVQYMPLAVLQSIVEKMPTIEGVAIVFGMGPFVTGRNGRERELRTAYLRRIPFLDLKPPVVS